MESMYPTPENVASWRDLTDQLSAEQIADLENLERDLYRLCRLTGNADLCWDREALLNHARGHSRDNLVAAMVGEVPLPVAGASAGIWQEHEPMPYRVVFGPRRVILSREGEDFTIETSAIRFSDGRVDDGSVEGPAVHIGDRTFTSLQARHFAAALIEAADEIQRLDDNGAS